MKIIIALALLGRGAQAQINTLKYTQVGVGACRGNGGPADKVSGVYTQGQTQAWCEQQCDLQPDCVGYAFHDVAAADCGDGKAHYEPGFVGSSGCCHCEASCDHSQETSTDCTYYDAQGDGDDHGGHDHGHGGGSDAAECAFDAPESKPFGPCQASDTYPLFCTAAEAEAMSPSNGHHMMAGLFMPNGVDPMCHGNYVGDATACECEDATKNDDGSDGALATTLGYGAIAAAALLA